MAHFRPRLVHADLVQLLAFSPIVGVLGHRQVGKTTLVTELSEREYLTMDTPRIRDFARTDPESFVAGLGKQSTLDESQLAPEVFPVLKERVRKHRRPGEFLLTGSVRFTSRRAIRESLTGRIAYLEVSPLTLAELEQFRPRREIPSGSALIAGAPPKRTVESRNAMFARYLQLGGLPGVCFIRSAPLRAQRWEDQLRTLLDRDLRLVLETTLLYPTLRTLLAELAKRQGEPLEWAELSRATRISTPTLRKLLLALEGLFLVRTVPTFGGAKKQTVFFEDPGEAHFLAGDSIDPARKFAAGLFANLRVHYRGIGVEPTFSVFRTRGGAWIPLVVSLGKRTLGLVPIPEEGPTASVVGSARAFLSRNPNGEVFLVHQGAELKAMQRGIFSVPVGALL